MKIKSHLALIRWPIWQCWPTVSADNPSSGNDTWFVRQ